MPIQVVFEYNIQVWLGVCELHPSPEFHHIWPVQILTGPSLLLLIVAVNGKYVETETDEANLKLH